MRSSTPWECRGRPGRPSSPRATPPASCWAPAPPARLSAGQGHQKLVRNRHPACPDVRPGHGLAHGIDPGDVIRPRQRRRAGAGRGAVQDGIRRENGVCSQQGANNKNDLEFALHVISLPLPRCNKANYCVTSALQPSITATYKKNDKIRRSGQVRGQKTFQDRRRPGPAPAFFFRATLLVIGDA